MTTEQLRVHRVGVIGAKGRMGSEVCRAVSSATDMELCAAIDIGDDLGALAEAHCSEVVHFSHPDVVVDHIRFATEHGMNSVIGTSGFTADRVDMVRALVGDGAPVGVLIAPNFALGAVLAMRFAGIAARYFESAEVVELHHAGKVDAPSGTALAASAAIAKGRAAGGLGAVPDATTRDPHGSRGAIVDGIHTHAVRLPGLVAHLEVLLGSAGETLTIRHDSFNRESFMPGVLAAIRGVGAIRGVAVGLENVLDL